MNTLVAPTRDFPCVVGSDSHDIAHDQSLMRLKRKEWGWRNLGQDPVAQMANSLRIQAEDKSHADPFKR